MSTTIEEPAKPAAPTPTKVRIAALALLFALPELALILCEIWVVIYIAQWVFSGMFNIMGPLLWALRATLFGAGAWLTYQIARLAVVNRNIA